MFGLGKISKISSIVAVFCIVVYIAAIAFGVVSIIVNIGERRNLAENEFFDLADTATSAAVSFGFMSSAYQEIIGDFIDISSTLLGVIITGSNGEFAFERYPGSGIVWTGTSPRFRTGAGFPREPFFLPLRIDGQRNVTIQAIFNPLDHRFFQQTLRNTLLAVLAALIIAFLTLILELNLKNKARASSADTFTMRFEGRSKSKPAEPINRTSGAYTPQGLYSPRGNIGWESYTQDRLSSELQRCASFEQDLVFIIMELNSAPGFYRLFADETVNFFSMRDLIFDRGESGISVIIPNANLEDGMRKAEDFRILMSARLSEFFDNKAQNYDLYIGLSTRSGRLIEADRLMFEAQCALEKARLDPVARVVAFKSDLEKYREFIKSHHKK